MRTRASVAGAVSTAVLLGLGCGGGGSASDSPERTVNNYVNAIRDRNGDAACAELTPHAVNMIVVLGLGAFATGANTCAGKVENAAKHEEIQTIFSDNEIKVTDRSATSATVEVTQPHSKALVPLQLKLVKQGNDWKINGR